MNCPACEAFNYMKEHNKDNPKAYDILQHKTFFGSISEALSKLSFPTLDHALNYYSDIQHWLYAA